MAALVPPREYIAALTADIEARNPIGSRLECDADSQEFTVTLETGNPDCVAVAAIWFPKIASQREALRCCMDVANFAVLRLCNGEGEALLSISYLGTHNAAVRDVVWERICRSAHVVEQLESHWDHLVQQSGYLPDADAASRDGWEFRNSLAGASHPCRPAVM